MQSVSRFDSKNCLGFPALGFAILLCSASAAQAADRPVAFAVSEKQVQALGIQTAPLQRDGEAVPASFPAQVIVPPGQEQIVSAAAAGLVVQLFVQQNDRVRAGAPLVRIATAELGSQQLQLLQSASRAQLARQTAQREDRLFAEGIIPQRRVQEAHATLKESEAALHQAKAALRLAGMPASTIEHVMSTGRPEEALTLHASRAAVVTRVEVKSGQRVEAASALMLLAGIDRLWLEIQIPAGEASKWHRGEKLKVQGREIVARVESLGGVVSPASQTVALRASVESGGAGLRPGEMVAVVMPDGAAADGWSVPLSALAYEGTQAYVFVRTAEGFEARPVSVTASGGQKLRVRGALKANEQIAMSSVVALKGAWMSEREKP